jgi:hypothetical protein
MQLLPDRVGGKTANSHTTENLKDHEYLKCTCGVRLHLLMSPGLFCRPKMLTCCQFFFTVRKQRHCS